MASKRVKPFLVVDSPDPEHPFNDFDAMGYSLNRLSKRFSNLPDSTSSRIDRDFFPPSPFLPFKLFSGSPVCPRDFPFFFFPATVNFLAALFSFLPLVNGPPLK